MTNMIILQCVEMKQHFSFWILQHHSKGQHHTTIQFKIQYYQNTSWSDPQVLTTRATHRPVMSQMLLIRSAMTDFHRLPPSFSRQSHLLLFHHPHQQHTATTAQAPGESRWARPLSRGPGPPFLTNSTSWVMGSNTNATLLLPVVKWAGLSELLSFIYVSPIHIKSCLT